MFFCSMHVGKSTLISHGGLSTFPCDNSRTEAVMLQVERFIPYMKNSAVQTIALGYEDSDYDFVVILPQNQTEEGLGQTISEFNPQWFEDLRFTFADVRLPKFKLESHFDQYSIRSRSHVIVIHP
jgi:serine protease inhibitor